ncbi:MAG: hypothetical protein ISP91_15435, partial [Pseudomonadales bacterium]|nr:hypothetical protein [Pseudomonadales bacterium]
MRKSFVGAVFLLMASSALAAPTANDDPVVDDQTFDIDENSAYGTVVGTVVAYNEESVGCTPPDPGCQTLTFNVSG